MHINSWNKTLIKLDKWKFIDINPFSVILSITVVHIYVYLKSHTLVCRALQNFWKFLKIENPFNFKNNNLILILNAKSFAYSFFNVCCLFSPLSLNCIEVKYCIHLQFSCSKLSLHAGWMYHASQNITMYILFGIKVEFYYIIWNMHDNQYWLLNHWSVI